jgi:Dyp-type peroxidase family
VVKTFLIETNMSDLNFSQIQGFILSSYSKELPCATYMLLQISSKDESLLWLASVIDNITTAKERNKKRSLNIAFTCRGLTKLGLTMEDLSSFSIAFQEGMCSAHRSKILCDSGESAPENWDWGNDDNQIDVILLLFASDELTLVADQKKKEQEIKNCGGINLIRKLTAGRQPDSREHFGFMDGIGQPIIAGSGREKKQLHRTGHATVVKAGEFVLGYENELKVQDPIPSCKQMKDFGLDGTYLVFRQLEQHVSLLWNYIRAMTLKKDGSVNMEAEDKLGAKMMGRWKSGAPLAIYPNSDPIKDNSINEENNFSYKKEDEYGLRCPLGSHIRRANPRDSLGPDPETALQSSKRHRIIRRGRSYGDRTKDPFNDDYKQRGLHFICLNSSIERQFEFIQQTWINNKTFAGLFDEIDPVVGAGKAKDVFTVPEDCVRTRILKIPEVITMKGGAYFFMPSIAALRYLVGSR